MTTKRPPSLALALLRRVAADNEPLVGDLIEEFESGRSASWFWRQVVMTALTRPLAPRRARRHGPRLPLNARRPQEEAGLLDIPTITSGPRPIGFMNISSVQVEGIGGLGLIVTAVCVALEFEQLRASMALAILGGSLLGGLMIVLRRRRGPSVPRRDDPADLLRAALSPERVAPRGNVTPGPHALSGAPVVAVVR